MKEADVVNMKILSRYYDVYVLAMYDKVNKHVLNRMINVYMLSAVCRPTQFANCARKTGAVCRALYCVLVCRWGRCDRLVQSSIRAGAVYRDNW